MTDYIAFDLETTGFSPETCEIIEIGAWKIKGGAVVDKFCTLVRPIIYIPRTVQELTGITNEMVADAETLEPTLLEFFDFCEDLPFLGHNLPFDYRFLEYRGKFLGLDFTLKGGRQGIDTLKLSKKLMDCKSHKLEDIAKILQISVTAKDNLTYHRAEYDAYITKLIYDRFLFNYPNMLSVTTPEFLSLNDTKYGKVVNNDTLSFS